MKRLVKITVITLSMIIAVNKSESQNNWLQSAGGNANDEALGVVHDPNGNVYTCGYFSQTCRFDSLYLTANGMADVYISKQDSLGNYLWITRAGGGNSDRAHSITTDIFGNIIITGVFRDTAVFGNTTLVSSGNSQDIFIAKLDNNGIFLWSKSFGGSNTDIVSKLATDNSGNIIVCGEFKGTSSFGSFTFSSAVYPSLMQQQAGQPSYDAIIFKTDPNGNVVWAKAGTAPYDDRAVSVTTDNSKNIYVCGQYSDTITFGNTYNNNSFNAGFVMKMDSTGNETWFRRLVASQFMIYDIAARNGKVVITGDFTNTLSINSIPAQSVTGNFTNNIFTMCLDFSGNVQWTATKGSENAVSSRALFIDQNGETTITGYFKCEFTEFSNTYGNGIFNSTGFRDVYVLKYSGVGALKWVRYFGGTGDDIPSDVSAFNFSNPVISGTFSKTFNVPQGNSFQTHLYNYNFTNQNSFITHCSANNYGKFKTVLSNGNRDILITRPVDLNRPYYDFFVRQNGSCQLDTLMPQLLPVADTIVKCDTALLKILTPTTLDSISGPEWTYIWSNGSTNDSLVADATGWYYIDYGYKDECRTFRDSIYVIIFTTPATPAISASYGIIQAAIPVYACFEKLALMAGDTTTLTGGNYLPGYNVYWQTPFGIVNGSSVTTSQFGLYTFVVETPGGECSSQKCVEIYDYYSGNCNALGNPFVPQIIFTDSTFEQSDTVKICLEDHFEMWLVDSTLNAQGIQTNIATFVKWTINFGGYSFDPLLSYPFTFFEHRQKFKAWTSGNCSLTATVLHPITHLPVISTTRNFYLDVHAAPPNFPVISGPAFFCPGDTVTLSVSGGDNYQWNGPGIIQVYNQNTNADVVMMGEYGVTSTTIDTVLGCLSVAEAYFILQSIPAPSITMDPWHGVVCPLDSVLLTAEPGGNYTWYGPTGNVIGNTQSIYATVPGFYQYTYVSSSGCALESSSSEVLEYTTPYLEYDPVTHLCAGETTTISVQSNDMASIQWQSPLSGSNPVQVITQGGTYSATVSFCNITTQVEIVITESTSPAEILLPGPDTVCIGNTITLMGNPGMSDYNWNDGENLSQVYEVDQAGMYILETIDANGCESSDTIMIYNFPQPTAPVSNDTTICSGTTVTLTAQGNGTIYWYTNPENTIIAQTGDSLTITAGQNDSTFFVTNATGSCQSIATAVTIFIDPASVNPEILGSDSICVNDTLLLFVNTVAGTNYQWNGPNGFTSTDDTIIILQADNLTAGFYSLTASNGVCANVTDSIEIVVLEVVLQNFIQDSVFICQGDTLMINTDTLAGTYTWQNGNTGTYFLADQQGNYFYSFTNQYGCTANSDTLTVSWLAKPVLSDISDASVCPGTPIAITANGNGTINWYDTTLNLISSGDSLSFSEITQGTIILVQLTDTNGCESNIDTVFISLTPVLPAPFIDANDTICENGTLNLMTNTANGFTYNWNGPNGFTSSLEDPSIVPATLNDAGIYSLFINQGNCISDTAEIEITVNTLPELISSNDTGLCAAASVILYGYSSNGQIWNTGDTTSYIQVTPFTTTIYTVSTTNICGTVSDNITVIIFPNSNGSAGPDITVIYGNEGEFEASGGVSYEWIPADGLSCTTCPDPEVEVEEDTEYIVIITDQNGCVNTDTVWIFVEYNYNYFLPNTFTPNGDGTNDILYMRGYGVDFFELRIYDRWGEQIFKTNDLNTGWDGSYKGEPLSNAVFVYTLSGQLLDGKSFKEKGAVTLVK